MSNTTVEQFALERSMPAERLLEQLRAAGVSKNSAADSLSTEDKQKLLAYLKQSHGDTEGQKITVSRKQTSSVKTAAGTVQVQTRRRRSIQIDDGVSEVAAPEAVIEATVASTTASGATASLTPSSIWMLRRRRVCTSTVPAAVFTELVCLRLTVIF